MAEQIDSGTGDGAEPIEASAAGSGARFWESDWFTFAANSTHDIVHNLDLESPWLCMPLVVYRVEEPLGDWEAGDIIFTDGLNYLGYAEHSETGPLVSLAKNTSHIVFGNSSRCLSINKSGGLLDMRKACFKAKLVIRY